MRIIISPAKTMVAAAEDASSLPPSGLPVYLEEARTILSWLRSRSEKELRAVWMCSEKLFARSLEQLHAMDLDRNLTPAILAYDGIAFKYMAPGVFRHGEFDYVQEKLRILSGLYGALRPMDGVAPYRLEMQSKVSIAGTGSLYGFWGDRILRAVRSDDGIIVNLASKEYSKCISAHLSPEERLVSCAFVEPGSSGRLVEKSVHAKMARGAMVRFMAENDVQEPEGMKSFSLLQFA